MSNALTVVYDDNDGMELSVLSAEAAVARAATQRLALAGFDQYLSSLLNYMDKLRSTMEDARSQGIPPEVYLYHILQLLMQKFPPEQYQKFADWKGNNSEAQILEEVAAILRESKNPFANSIELIAHALRANDDRPIPISKHVVITVDEEGKLKDLLATNVLDKSAHLVAAGFEVVQFPLPEGAGTNNEPAPAANSEGETPPANGNMGVDPNTGQPIPLINP